MKQLEQLELELLASDVFDNTSHGDEGLFPNHTDKDIWMKGFIAGIEHGNHNMASCMLSILDSLKLYDNDSLVLDGETLSEVMFRKMKAYGIDLNKELGFTHLEPVTKEGLCECYNTKCEWYSCDGICNTDNFSCIDRIEIKPVKLQLSGLYGTTSLPDELQEIKTMYDFKVSAIIYTDDFFAAPKWKIASDKQGSGNTANIGSITDIEDLKNGNGVFSNLGEDWFDEYWMNYGTATMIKDGKSVKVTSIWDFLEFKGRTDLVDKVVAKGAKRKPKK